MSDEPKVSLKNGICAAANAGRGHGLRRFDVLLRREDWDTLRAELKERFGSDVARDGGLTMNTCNGPTLVRWRPESGGWLRPGDLKALTALAEEWERVAGRPEDTMESRSGLAWDNGFKRAHGVCAEKLRVLIKSVELFPFDPDPEPLEAA